MTPLSNVDAPNRRPRSRPKEAFSHRRHYGAAKPTPERWDGCRPPETASQCAKLMVLMINKRGRQNEGYNDWRGFGKISFPTPCNITDG